MPVLEKNYTDFSTMLASLGKIDRGRVVLETGGQYALPNRIVATYSGVTAEFLDHASQVYDHEVPTTLAAQGSVMRTVYNVREGQKLLLRLPQIDPERYHIDDEGTKWLDVRGLTRLFGKRYPEVNEELVEQLLQMDSSSLPWIPGRYLTTSPQSTFRRYKVTRLYRHDNDTINTLNSALREYFSPEI